MAQWHCTYLDELGITIGDSRWKTNVRLEVWDSHSSKVTYHYPQYFVLISSLSFLHPGLNVSYLSLVHESLKIVSG
jgi:hypothetical protein